jgi:hypothetical protein
MTAKLPVDALLDVLHNTVKRRTYAQSALNASMTHAGQLMREIAELDNSEKDVLGALKALGEGDFYETEDAA